MPINFTEQTFRSTYKDDHTDSDNYSRILFNAGRALQARELTQMQTIIQKEIKRFADNIYGKDGVPTKAGGVSINNAYPFIKISNDANNSFDDVTALENVILTGATSGIKVRIHKAVASELNADGFTDPDTLYVQYLDDTNTINPATETKTSASKVTPGEVLSNGGAINLTVQTTNTIANPAVGYGSSISIGASEFYAQGHFVFAPKQTVFLSKYQKDKSADIGFKIVQDIVTVSDTDALYDNQNITPNRSSPGADRYRIRLVLTRRQDIETGDTFVYFCRVRAGLLVHTMTSIASQDQVETLVNHRIKEIHGDFIKKYWKLRVSPNGDNSTSTLRMKVEPGIAYLNGRRLETLAPWTLIIPKATDTFVDEDEQIGINYGNYYYFDSGKGMLDVDTAESVTLYDSFDSGAGNIIGTANIRAITEGYSRRRVGKYTYQTNPTYKAHLFNIKRTDYNYSLQDVKRIEAANGDKIRLVLLDSATHPTLLNKTILHEPKSNGLLTRTPIVRPKSFTEVVYTFMKKYEFTASGTSHTLTLTDAGETFVNENDIVVSSSTSFVDPSATPSITGGNKQISITGLTNGRRYEVLSFVSKTNASVKTKTLTETTVSSIMDSDGNGVRYLNFGKSDIYSVSRITTEDSDGTDVFPHFLFDDGGREGFVGDGRLVWTGGGLDSANQPVFARFKYFAPSVTGQFYAVNSYDGEVDYNKIPALKTNTIQVNLRDFLDFRPSTDGSGNFTTIPPLPVPTDTVQTKAEYYLPRKDKLVITKNSELKYLKGISSLNPKYPTVRADEMDLYNIKLNPNTLNSQDMKYTLIPRRGYTMKEIGALEDRIDRLEEMTTLSLLELNTKFLSVLDSNGLDRTKSGFFVDSFKDHKFSAASSPEYRASIDNVDGGLFPDKLEDAIDVYFDSAEAANTTTISGDLVTLNYNSLVYQAQELASNTENLAPFFVPQIIGDLELSPSVDRFYDVEIVGENVLNESTVLDLTDAKNWNSSQNSWFGVDPSTLEVGDTSSFSTTFSYDLPIFDLPDDKDDDGLGFGHEQFSGMLPPVEDAYYWYEDGSTVSVSAGGTTVATKGGTTGFLRTAIDAASDGISALTDNSGDGGSWYSTSSNSIDFDFGGLADLWPVYELGNTSVDKSSIKDVFIDLINEFENGGSSGNDDRNHVTRTTTTVNRVASESTIRDVIGTNVVQTIVLPWMRSRKVLFKATGLRPNTQYFPFFDNVNVSNFCREETFKDVNTLNTQEAAGNNDQNGAASITNEHSEGKSNLIADNDGVVEGSFEIPNNNVMRFATGIKEFILLDTNARDLGRSLSFARGMYEASGQLTKKTQDVTYTRTLKIIGTESTTSSGGNQTGGSSGGGGISFYPSYDEDGNVILSSSSKESQQISALSTDTTDNREYTTADDRFRYVDASATTYVEDHSSDTDTPAGGNSSTEKDTADVTQTAPAEGDVAESLSYIIGRAMSSFNGDDTGRVYYDPVAQTFEVPEQEGRFVTSIEVFFASKGEAGVRMELRPTVNGVPHSSLAIATVRLSASQVNLVPSGSNNKTMLQNGTTFTFREPVYLSGGTDYAIVLIPERNDPNYNVYVATVGENQLNSNEAFIAQQPTLGSFFKSQNSRTWEPASNVDLAYRIKIAKFASAGRAYLHNVNLPPKSLHKDPFVVDSGSNVVRVMMRGHGLRTGDKAWIRGIDSATNFGNGLTGASVVGVRTVVGYDNTSYTFLADDSATSRKWFGGTSVTSSRNLNFEAIRPELDITTFDDTVVTVNAKTTSQQALAGAQTRYVKDTNYSIIENNKRNYFSQPKAIYNRRNEVASLSGNRSLDFEVVLRSANPYISPVINIGESTVNTFHYMISRQNSVSSTGFHAPLTYIPETNFKYGTESAKHVTREVTLATDAVGLKIMLAANRPPEADFQLYYRTAQEGDPLNRKGWTIVTPQTSPSPNTNVNIFSEYRYLIGGDGGALEPFTKFQLKIVMRSTNSARVPSFRDLRVIALAI